jgi:exopolyphosphatase
MYYLCIFVISAVILPNHLVMTMSLLRKLLIKSRALTSSSSLIDVINGPRLVLCLGNEAADADSIISALCYAHIKNKNLVSDHPHSIYIPIVNTKRSTIHLRRDVEVLLSYVELSLQELICVDELQELDLEALTKKDKLGMILLDHNELSSSLQSRIRNYIPVSSYIDGILDHHQDQGLYPHLSAERRNVAFDSAKTTALVGSCCTLVVEELLASASARELAPEVGLLLKGVILADTINMDAKAGKGTARDLHALDELDRLDTKIASINRTEFFDKLANAKTDINFWRSLSAAEALSLDFKDFSFPDDRVIGIASVLLSLQESIAKDDFEDAVEKLLADGRSMVIIMSLTFTSADTGSQIIERQLMFLSKNSDDLIPIETVFQAKDMQLARLNLDDASIMNHRYWQAQAYQQGNIAMSRKQVAAILQNHYDK